MENEREVEVEEPREELRLAVVLNGGVSLAVWIGGVALEIDRMTRREGPYAKLLDLVHSHARADVITGTSAGGINGAALALAQVNRSADLTALRSLWATEGTMEALLRTPFQGAPSSLLQGDEYFLPTLERAMQALAVDYDPMDAQERPVHLAITTTLLTGGRSITSDALGQTIPQSLHAGVLTFQHLEPSSATDGEERDDFAETGIAETVRRLALAARSSAGFPVAFEPAFLPLQPAGVASPSHTVRPNLFANAQWVDRESPVDQSRYGVDGGVLVNTPTIAALDAIDSLPSRRAVRRMMLLVFPHAPEDVPVLAAEPGTQPTVAETLTGIVGAMRGEAGRTHIENVERHNRRAASRRGGRADVLTSLLWQAKKSQKPLLSLLDERTDSLFEHYRDIRIRRSARDFADRAPTVAGWSYERVLRAAEVAQDELLESPPAEAVLPYVPGIILPFSMNNPTWPWGLTTAEHVVDDVLDLLRRLAFARPSAEMTLALQDARQIAYAARARLLATRREFGAMWCTPLFRTLPRTSEFWKIWLSAYRRAYLGAPDVQGADLAALSTDEQTRDSMATALNGLESGGYGRIVTKELGAVATAVVNLSPLIRGAAEAADQGQTMSDSGREDSPVLQAWVELLHGLRMPGTQPLRSASDDELITRLIRLDVVTSCLSNAPDHGSEQIVELAQISLQTTNAFATTTTSAADKLGGNRLGRFAGFLKESWRINDWTWGRLDAATMLCRVALEPRRVRRWVTFDASSPREMADRFAAELIEDLFPHDKPGEGFPTLCEQVVDELEQYVFAERPVDIPPTLEHLASLFAWAIQADIAAEELPALRVAVESDVRAGAARGSAGARFVAEHERLLRELRDLPPQRRGDIPKATDVVKPAQGREVTDRRDLGIQALRAFDRAGVGREPLDQEASGDLLIRTGITAAAVGITMLDSPSLGVPAARPFTRTLRGVALVPYWLARGLTGGSQIAKALAMAGLAIGAATLGVSLLASSTPRWVALLGLCAVLFSIGYSALRTGSLLHGLVLVSPTVPLIVYALAERADAPPGSADRPVDSSPLLLVVLALVVGALVLGSIPGLASTPLAVTGDHPVRTTAAVLTLVAILVLVVSDWLVDWTDPLSDTVNSQIDAARGWVTDRQTSILLAVALAAVVVLALFAELSRSRTSQLRTWYPVPKQRVGGDPAGAAADPGLVWLQARVIHPAGVAAAWAWVYAALATISAVVLALVTSSAFDGGTDMSSVEQALWATVATAAVLAVGLLVAVLWLPARAKRRFDDKLVGIATGGAFKVIDDESDSEEALRRRLLTRGTTYQYLLTPNDDDSDLELTPAGRALAKRLRDAVHRPEPTRHERRQSTELLGTRPGSVPRQRSK